MHFHLVSTYDGAFTTSFHSYYCPFMVIYSKEQNNTNRPQRLNSCPFTGARQETPHYRTDMKSRSPMCKNLRDGQFYVCQLGYGPIIHSNTNLGVTVKILCRGH